MQRENFLWEIELNRSIHKLRVELDLGHVWSISCVVQRNLILEYAFYFIKGISDHIKTMHEFSTIRGIIAHFKCTLILYYMEKKYTV